MFWLSSSPGRRWSPSGRRQGGTAPDKELLIATQEGGVLHAGHHGCVDEPIVRRQSSSLEDVLVDTRDEPNKEGCLLARMVGQGDAWTRRDNGGMPSRRVGPSHHDSSSSLITFDHHHTTVRGKSKDCFRVLRTSLPWEHSHAATKALKSLSSGACLEGCS